MKQLYSWMENTVIQHIFVKFDQNQAKPKFSIKTSEPQMKQENPISSEKSQQWQHWLWLLVPQKVCVSVTLCIFAQAHSLSKCANMHCTDVDWLVHTTLAVIPQSDLTRTSLNLKQKHIVSLIPGRTDPRITPRRPVSIEWISRAAWANHDNCQC